MQMVIKRKLKVLVSAYACEPDKGSEPGIGWNWVRQIAKHNEVWVLTRKNNREPIERELEQNPMPNAHFVYLDLPYWMRFWKRGPRGLHLYYCLWQIAAFIRARYLYCKIPFDLSHQITFLSDWRPSFLPLLRVPFIWGPIGSQEAPKALKSEIGQRGRIQERIKAFVRWYMQHLDPFFVLTLRRAKVIIAGDSGTLFRIPDTERKKSVVIPQNGINFAEIPTTRNTPVTSDQLTILSIGRFIYFKGFPPAIKAFARFVQQHPNARLILIGAGPEYHRLQHIVSEKGIGDKVEFHDWMSRAEVLKFMQTADIFLFPSYEGGGMVVLEAMAAGKPVVCLEAGGPGEAVTEECGVKVKMQNRDQIVQDLSKALYKLAKDPLLRRKMGEASKRRIRETYDWDQKGKQIQRLYESVMGEKK